MGDAPALTEVERWLLQHAPPERLDSARALYEWMPRQRGGQLPFVDRPYDPAREADWADAARVADFIAHAPPEARRILDVGPGDGWPALPVAAALPHALIVGADPSPRRTERCTANARRLGLPNARFVTADAAALPFRPAAFDLVTAAYSLEEAAAPEAVFEELARVLRPGGVLRVAYQDWRLAGEGFEGVLLWDAPGALLYTYVRRIADPPRERRYTLVLPPGGEAARAHADALVAAAEAPRAFGETLLTHALGVPLLGRLAPYARRSMLVELRRWRTAWLLEALRAAGFSEVRATADSGDLARRFARDLIARGAIDRLAPHFEDVTRALARAAVWQRGDTLVTAVR